jgi:hypothetical protein
MSASKVETTSKLNTTTIGIETKKSPLPPPLQANCKTIWGAKKNLNLEIVTEHQTEKDPQYTASVRWIRGENTGPILLATGKYKKADEAETELAGMAEAFLRAKRENAGVVATAAKVD